MKMVHEPDESCDKILGFFIARNQKFRFNELHRALNNLNYKISKPTLSKHLKHLVENKWLKRNIGGVQNVSYEMNWNVADDLKKARDDSETLMYYMNDLKIFSSKPFDEQIDYLEIVLLLKAMHRLRFIALAFLEPERAFDYNLQYRAFETYLLPMESWFAQRLQENKEEVKTKVLPKIEADIEKFKKALFVPRPQS